MFGIQVNDTENSANGGHFHLPPLHSTLFAVVASHRKEDCFTPYWQSVSSIWSGQNRLKHEEARLTLLQPLWTWLCDLKRPNGLLHSLDLSPSTKPGQRRIRCLSHAVNLNDVFHMFSCCGQISLCYKQSPKTVSDSYIVEQVIVYNPNTLSICHLHT